MKLDPVNAVSSFHYYMWNAWGEEECKITFGCAYKHFWKKWNSLASKSILGAAERFYAELSDNNRELLVGKSSVSCPLKPSDSAPLKHSTMPP